MSSPTYIIVGSGVFGASTALYMIRKYPHASVTLIDRDNFTAATRVAASWDWNKVIRADYNEIVYTKLALEAQQLWRTDQIWQPFYHESGVVYITHSKLAEKVIKNFDDLGVKVDVRACSVEETRTLYDGAFADADYTNIKEVLVNRTSGWAEAKEALQSTIQTAVDLGVKYITAEVTAVEFVGGPENRICRGVKTSTGEIITADHIILCTGAFTPRLLMDSAPESAELHAGSRIQASAVTEAIAPLIEQQRSFLETMPVGVNDNPTANGCDYGCLPLPKLNAFKYWGQVIFRNTVEHPITKESLSMPPSGPNYNQWDVPLALKEDVRGGPRSVLGNKNLSDRFEEFRICWEALTPSADFIISPHSACSGLFIATCGSFHGFKFLPILGKYVVEMLAGELDPNLQKRWAWDRELPPTEDNKQWSTKELKDLSG
ncbi:FAD dependent oxidoreductase [Mollisia scopiformis]|uniref:FAD dependent oxidoreductase n=1 Tax=Mollisia scopiformis TaxID=149040 RepID=A0A194X2Y0_MOLSC|nr:FAD dependent oxidoreductase [Mollisia scopiformis]KUJ14545.1 FAD dependent oxidoreductase [Mollisia scopiformis]